MTYSKDIYLNSVGGKTSQRDKIGKKYLQVISQIGEMYDSAAKELQSRYQLQRSQLSAQSKISQANTSAQLAQKGLSKSGESIQSSILSDMAYMGALTSLGNDEASKLNELNAQRYAAMSAVQKDMLNAQNEADRLEAQMEYQKSRDDISDSRWEKEFNYNASRDSVNDYHKNRQFESDNAKWQAEQEYKKERDAESDRRWNTQYLYDVNRDAIEDDRAERAIARDIYENDRDYNFDMQKYQDSKNQQSFENNLSQREADLKKSQIQNENYIKAQYLELEREKQEYDMKYTKSGSHADDIKYDFGYAVNAQGFIVPDVTPDKFLDNMIKGNGMNKQDGEVFIIPADFEKRVNALLEDERIDKGYRQLLEICARSRGIIK
ncbi:MAG: hypothetical protein E7588_10035 [Ruminococcaceae bacterium]|nr:hypothetical protein [Oscillospiraceae bacterium]